MRECANIKNGRQITSRIRRWIRRILFSFLALILIFLTAVLAVWHNELRSALSIRQLTSADASHHDGATYSMTVYGDYDFDGFLEQGGASSDSELISFITDSITKGILPMELKTRAISCSSFTALTEEGDRIFGRNYDFDRSTNTMIVATDPGHGRHASVSTIDLQFLSIEPDDGISSLKDYILCLAAPFVPLDGVNDAGVSCGIYMSFQGRTTTPTDLRTDRPDITSTTMLRMILDYAGSVDEAVELVQQYDLHDSASTSYHYMVADSTGKSAILEWVNGTDSTDNDGSARHLVVTYNDLSDGNNSQVVTNYIVTEGYYDGESAADMKGLDRRNILTDALENCGGVVKDEQAGMDLLQSVGRRLLNHSVYNVLTIHSVVYNLTDRTALWVGNEHYGEADHTFELNVKYDPDAP